jgi:hypothetical protein
VVLRVFASAYGVILSDPFVDMNGMFPLEEADWFRDTLADDEEDNILRFFSPRKLFKVFSRIRRMMNV